MLSKPSKKETIHHLRICKDKTFLEWNYQKKHSFEIIFLYSLRIDTFNLRKVLTFILVLIYKTYFINYFWDYELTDIFLFVEETFEE